MLSIKTVNGLAHYTDWIIAHVHTGALGWNGLLTFGMVYWLMLRSSRRSPCVKAVEVHFWLATARSSAAAIYSATDSGPRRGAPSDATGRLQFPDFVETTMRLMPMYRSRAAGGLMYLLAWAPSVTTSSRPGQPGLPPTRSW
ncbi:MAG: cbb3-type cytochrome c oxidase subunit I [Gemmatimonadales bacterium]